MTRTLSLDDPRLLKAAERAKAARYALLEGGMSPSCSCNLCIANRLILSALGILGVVDAEIVAEKKARAVDQLELQLRDGVAPEDEKR